MLSLSLAFLLLQAANPVGMQRGGQEAAKPPVTKEAASSSAEDPAVTALALRIYAQMRAGRVDESLLSAEMNKALSPEALAQQKPVFDELGEPTKLTFEKSEAIAQGMRYEYLAVFAKAQLHVRIFIDKDGKVAGYFLTP